MDIRERQGGHAIPETVNGPYSTHRHDPPVEGRASAIWWWHSTVSCITSGCVCLRGSWWWKRD